MIDTTQTERYKACLDLYLESAGRNLSRIERKMRELGFSDFNRRILYSRIKKGRYCPGWIERFQWHRMLTKLSPSSKPLNFASIRSGSTISSFTVPNKPKQNPKSDPDFQAWLKKVSPDMNWDARHQKLIYEHLQRITSGESKRLMIFMPPRHGKSELVTVRYTSWRLWNDPKMRVILGSYNQSLANSFSRSIRRVLSEEEDLRQKNSPHYEGAVVPSADTRFPSTGSSRSDRSQIENRNSQMTRMFPPSRTINTSAQWETAVGGGVKAVGVGAGVTGFGAGLIVIDDPVKSREQAESETFRDKLWNWYNNDLYTRLEPNGAIILIQTRWHEDDLAGRLLREMENGGQEWNVINLPALAETAELRTADCEMRIEDNELSPLGRSDDELNADTQNPQSAVRNPQSKDPLGRTFGEALWPERFPVGELADTQRQIGSYAFSALYQQRPTPAEGGIFKREWFKRYVEKPPEGLNWKRGYDLAVSTKTQACYTASFRVAYDDDGNLYIADGFRKRVEFPDQKRYVLSRIKDEKSTEHGIERALHGQALLQELRKEARVRGIAFKGVTVSTDKVTRALKWAPLAEENKIILVRGHWNNEFIEEVCQFPAGHFDDQIDAVSLAVAMFEHKGSKLYTF